MSLETSSLLLGLSQAVFALAACAALALVGRSFLVALGLGCMPQPASAAPLGDVRLAQGAHSTRALALFLWVVVGLALANAALFVLGLAGLLYARLVGLTFALMILAALVHLRWSDRALKSWAAVRGLLPLPALPVTWVFTCLVVALTWWSVRPAGMWDDTSYHLPYARHYLEQGGIALNPYLRFPLFPHHANLWFAVGLMAGSDVHAQVVATAIPTALTALGVFGVCQWLLGSIRVGCLAVAIMLTAAPLHEAMGYAYVDHLLMLYVWAALVCLALAVHAGGASSRNWIVLCGLLAGSAASTKTFGALVSVLLGFAILLTPGLRWRAAWPYALAVAVSGLGWYLRSWIISGDPVHPLGGNLFGHFLWNAEDLKGQHDEQATHGVSRALWNLPWALHFAGLALLLPALVAPLLKRLRAPVFLAWTGLFAAYTLVWHTNTQVARYMIPMLPLGAVLVAALCWVLTERMRAAITLPAPTGRRAKAGIAGLCMLGAMAAPASAYMDMFQRVTLWDATLSQRSGYAIMRHASRLTGVHGTRLVHVGYANAVYFFEGTAIGDWFGPGRWSEMLACAEVCSVVSQERMAQVLATHKARMLAVNSATFKFNPADYQALFTVIHTTGDGVLLVLK
jgi:hypothetical protein